MSTNTALADFIWKNADDLWGNFKHVDFGKIILPFTLLRRLECVLEPTRDQVRETVKNMKDSGIDLDVILRTQTGYPFYNTSNYDLRSLGATRTRQNLEDYIASFSDNARVIFEQFDFANTLARMDKAGVLYKICQNFAAIDLHPDAVPERVMSNVYEHLIRRFGAEVNEAAEDFMTPRDVVHLAIELLLDPDDQMFIDNPGLIRTLYDPTCGTGGFLSDGMEHVNALRDRYSVAPVIVPYGQELEPETHAVCLASMLLKTVESDPGRDLSKNIKLGSTLSDDKLLARAVPLLRLESALRQEVGDGPGRRGPGASGEGVRGPLRPQAAARQRRVDAVPPPPPQQAGDAGARRRTGGDRPVRLAPLQRERGARGIRDPALPAGEGCGRGDHRASDRDLLPHRDRHLHLAPVQQEAGRTGKGKVQLIDATALFEPMRKSEGNKRRRVGDDQIRQIVQMYADFAETKESRDFRQPRLRLPPGEGPAPAAQEDRDLGRRVWRRSTDENGLGASSTPEVQAAVDCAVRARTWARRMTGTGSRPGSKNAAKRRCRAGQGPMPP